MFVDTLQARKELQDNRYKHIGSLVGLIVCGVMSLGSFFYLLTGNAMDHPLNSIFAFFVYIAASFAFIMLVVAMPPAERSGKDDDGE
ncbi:MULTISPECIES: hypothetical protein [Actinomycetes]|uniref:hypothetical protein n=1 Tax=Actinomycetes TaxID=1760 RepID=UPI0003B4979E|nr:MULTISPECIES: hypothetical protein [Actinomycetes]